MRTRLLYACLLLALVSSPPLATPLASPNPVRVSLSVFPTAVSPGQSVSIRASAHVSDPDLRLEFSVVVEGPGFAETLYRTSGGASASWEGRWKPPGEGTYTLWVAADARDAYGAVRGSATTYSEIVVSHSASGSRAGGAASSGGEAQGSSGGLLGRIGDLARKAWSGIEKALSGVAEVVRDVASAAGRAIRGAASELAGAVGEAGGRGGGGPRSLLRPRRRGPGVPRRENQGPRLRD